MLRDVFLGISCGFHDSAVALVGIDGSVLFASSEERFTRIKGDSSWPAKAILKALEIASKSNYLIVGVCCHENPQKNALWALFSSFNPFFNGHISFEKVSSSLSRYSSLVSRLESLLIELKLTKNELYLCDHHVAHAMASYAYSDLSSGIICVLDAFGQGSSGFVGYIDNKTQRIRVKARFGINNSVGLFYSSITKLCGFKVLTGEYKLMGLAPYGQPIMYDNICNTFGDPDQQSFSTSILDPFADDLVSKELEKAIGIASRVPESKMSRDYMDLAASAQKYLEDLVLSTLKYNLGTINSEIDKHILLGGGVALNCKLTQRLQKEFTDYKISICPASGDAGSAIGACYAKAAQLKSSKPVSNKNTYLGNSIDSTEVKDYLDVLGFRVEKDHSTYLDKLVLMLSEGEIGAVFLGKAEFGPRALGNRSILADPSKANALKKINRYIKSREDFRPLAPITTPELACKYFGLSLDDDLLLHHMLTLVDVPASIQDLVRCAVHVDGTARIQLIGKHENAFISSLISSFYQKTGVPALINTSFNQRGEPIVDSIDDALTCFSSSQLDFMLIENSLIIREEQSSLALSAYTRIEQLELD